MAATTSSNPFVNFLKKFLHVVEAPFTNAKKVEQVFEGIEKGIVDAPEAKTLVVGLVQQFEALGPDGLAAITGEGMNFVADEKTFADAVNVFKYFKNTFVPGIEKIYADVKADVTGSTSTAAAAAPAASTSGAPAPAVVTQHTGAAD